MLTVNGKAEVVVQSATAYQEMPSLIDRLEDIREGCKQWGREKGFRSTLSGSGWKSGAASNQGRPGKDEPRSHRRKTSQQPMWQAPNATVALTFGAAAEHVLRNGAFIFSVFQRMVNAPAFVAELPSGFVTVTLLAPAEVAVEIRTITFSLSGAR